MRTQLPGPDDVASWRVAVTSQLGTRSLAADIPLSGGSLTWATLTTVLEESDITVPADGEDPGRWWPRRDPDHPLARFGQRLQYELHADTPTGTKRVALARHRVQEWDRQADGSIEVACRSTMADLATDELPAPISTRAGSPLTGIAMTLASTGTDITFDPALVNRTVPAQAWGESRVDGLQEVAAAWPALLRLDPWGRVAFRTPLQQIPAPVLSFTDGEGGTVVSVDGQGDTRDGVYNVVIAQGRESASGVQFRRTAQVMQGPLAPARYGSVVARVESELITSESLAMAVARAELSRTLVRAATWQVTTVPDWRVEVDDPVLVTRAGETRLGYVTGIVAPVAPGDLMRIAIGVLE